MSILSKIFGTGDVVKAGFDLIDDMHTSDVEEIEAKTKAKTDLLASYAAFKVAQRYLALIFTATFVSSFLLVLGMTLAGKGDLESVRMVLSEFYVGEIMLTIIAFYFGGGFIEGAFHAKKKQ